MVKTLWASFAFGNDHDVVREHPHARGAPPDIAHISFLPGLQLDEIPDADRLFHQDMHAGEQVAQRILKGQRDGEAPDAQRGQKRGDRDPQCAQQYQTPHAQHDPLDHGLRKAGDRDLDFGFPDRIDHEPGDEVGQNQRNREDHKDMEDLEGKRSEKALSL